MAKVRESKQAALLVVDVQQGVMKNAWNADNTIQNVATAVTQARASNMPVSSELTIPAAHIVAELNTTLRWLSYPGLRNAVMPLSDVFANHKP